MLKVCTQRNRGCRKRNPRRSLTRLRFEALKRRISFVASRTRANGPMRFRRTLGRFIARVRKLARILADALVAGLVVQAVHLRLARGWRFWPTVGRCQVNQLVIIRTLIVYSAARVFLEYFAYFELMETYKTWQHWY